MNIVKLNLLGFNFIKMTPPPACIIYLVYMLIIQSICTLVFALLSVSFNTQYNFFIS